MPDGTWWGSCRIRSAATLRYWVARMAPASSSLWTLAMGRSTLAICALLTVATLGCEQVDAAKAKLKLAWDKVRGRSTATAPAAPARPAPDTAGARIAAEQQQQAASRPRAPAAVRRVGSYTYLFFRNGCEYTCGTMDVVTLENGRVVDAIVRWDGHRYSGESWSPVGKVPFANPGGEQLQVK